MTDEEPVVVVSRALRWLRRRPRTSTIAGGVVCTITTIVASTYSSSANGAEASPSPTAVPAPPPPGRASAPEPDQPNENPPGLRLNRHSITHLWTALGAGRGLRLNNPFRLQDQLGSSAESLSWSAPTLELALAALWGNPVGFQHGVSFNASFALNGIPQQVLAPGYMLLHRTSPHFSFWARLALPVVTQPDPNVGIETGLGVQAKILAGLGLYAELVGSAYEGAATDERAATLIPLLSAHAGLSADYEVLP